MTTERDGLVERLREWAQRFDHTFWAMGHRPSVMVDEQELLRAAADALSAAHQRAEKAERERDAAHAHACEACLEERDLRAALSAAQRLILEWRARSDPYHQQCAQQLAALLSERSPRPAPNER